MKDSQAFGRGFDSHRPLHNHPGRAAQSEEQHTSAAATRRTSPRVLPEMDSAANNQQGGTDAAKANPVITGWPEITPALGTVLGIAVVLARVHLPSVLLGRFELIGSATSGVAVFSVGLVLAVYPVRLLPGVLAGSLARVAVQYATLFVLLHLRLVKKPILARGSRVLQFPTGNHRDPAPVANLPNRSNR